MAFLVETITVPLTSRSISDAPALDALPAAVAVDAEGTRERGVMELSTAHLLGALIASCAPSEVGASRARLKVTGVDAVTDSAQMVQVDPALQRPMLLDVEGSVSQSRAEEGSAHLPVSIRVQRPLPPPAPIVIHNVLSPVVDKWGVCGAGNPVSPVVLLAHAQLETTGHALRVSDDAPAHWFHGRTLLQDWR